MIELTLPWPPSVNRYWRRNGGRYFISNEGKVFRTHVEIACLEVPKIFYPKDRLFIGIAAYPPDRRRRDLDNVLKSLLDALQHGGIYHDDNQIDDIRITRQESLLGQVSIQISKMEFQNPRTLLDNQNSS